MVKRSVHDNRIVRYLVDGDHQRIILHTRFDGRESVEFTDIVFEGVLAYYFEGDNFENIILDVEEVPLPRLMSENRDLFVRGRDYAWPGSWNESPESSLHYLESEVAKRLSYLLPLGWRVGWWPESVD
jgi:hypothetical protein